MPHPLTARWTLPGPTANYLVVGAQDEAARSARPRLPSASVIPVLERWLVSHQPTLQEMHDALEGSRAGPPPAPGARQREAQLKQRLTDAFRTGRLVVLAEDPAERARSSAANRAVGAKGVEQLRSTLAREQFRDLAEAMAEAEFLHWLKLLFGSDIPAEAYKRLRSALLAGKLPDPEIRLVEGGLNGHAGAYDRKQRAIHVSRELVRRARGDNHEAWKLLIILIEEFGHHVDNLLRKEYSKIGGDAPLDEGAQLAYALINLGWNEGQVRCEFARLMTEVGEVPLEVEFSGLTRAVQQFLHHKERASDEKLGDLEFFGAGRGTGHEGAYGHESIEDALKAADFNEIEQKFVYFGNWLRDHSQVIDPKMIRKQGSKEFSILPSREALTRILDVMARAKFGDTSNFRVTTQKLGVYRNEEHIDNPSGMTDGRSIDPQFRGPCLPEELRVEPATLMKRYIRSSVPTGPGAARQYRVRDGDTLDSIARHHGLTWQELARYNFGTSVPEEVNRQLHTKVGCTRRTANGRNSIFSSQDQPGIIEIPGTTGSPGVEASYTALHYLSEQLRQAVRAGMSAEGHRLLGHALHTLEDFFSHSNFVEVALIHLGAWVEPWVPAPRGPKTPSRELPIITGKFGGLDTAASLSLGMAEKMLKEVECIPGQASSTSEIALILMDDYGFSKTHGLLGGLRSSYHSLEKKYPQAATLVCRSTAQVVKLFSSFAGGFVRGIGNTIDDAQTAFLEDPRSNDPTHSQLAKDHDDHPLHALAAELAKEAILDVGKKIKQAWAGGATADEVVATAAQYFVHPAHIRVGSGNAWVLDRVRGWVPSHGKDIARLGSRSWMVDWTRKKSAEWTDLMERAKRLMGARP